MERYTIIKKIGDGSYGSVYKALDKSTNALVAIKKIKRKYKSWEECLSLREINSLRKLSHPNIIKLKRVVKVNEEVFFIFEFMEGNLHQLINHSSLELTERKIRLLMIQALTGLKHAHDNGYFHRDLKPENLLVQDDTLKLADFGLARLINSKDPFTDYVSTRWYRAPEVLLHSKNYGTPIDIFALGTIMAELYLFRPIFPGVNERDQLLKQCTILGVPTNYLWPEGYRLASVMNFKFPDSNCCKLDEIIPKASKEALDLMAKMMNMNPKKRFTVTECINHPFLKDPLPVSNPESNLQNALNLKSGMKNVERVYSMIIKDNMKHKYSSAQGVYPILKLKEKSFDNCSKCWSLKKSSIKTKIPDIYSKSKVRINQHKLPVIKMADLLLKKENPSKHGLNYKSVSNNKQKNIRAKSVLNWSPHHNVPFYLPFKKTKNINTKK